MSTWRSVLLLVAWGVALPWAAWAGGCDRPGAAAGGGSGGAGGVGGGVPAGGLKAPYTVVATTGMVADLVRAVAGERATVTQLMGAGVDPHLFRPTRADVAALQGADVVVYSGLLLEGKMTETFEGLRASGKPVFAVTADLPAGDLDGSGAPGPGAGGGGDAPRADAGGHHDPHVWMNPRLWSRTLDVVERELSRLDPAGKDRYAANGAAYRKTLADLDAYAQGVLASVPERSRVLVTAHDAFGYFGRRYGYRVEGIQGISTESEAGVKDIQRLVDLLVERDVRAVFVESSVPERNVRALLAGAGAKGKTVTIGGSLFSDAMGRSGTYEGTYVGMIDHNVTTIVRALGGAAPERGMAGKLAVP